MKKTAQFLLILAVIWFLLLSSLDAKRKNGLDFVADSSPLLSKVQNGDAIVGVRTFLILFVWKSKLSADTLTKLSTTKDNTIRRKYLIDSLREKSLTIGTTSDFTGYLSRFFTHTNLSLTQAPSTDSLTSSYFTIYPQVDMCQRRNYFAKYDAILLDPYYFSYYVRFYRDVDMKDGIYMNSDDFVAIPLIPYEVYTQNTLKQSSEMFDYEVTNCGERPDISDAQFMRRLTGYSNFTMEDIELISVITRKSSLYGNWSWINAYTTTEMSEMSLNETWNNLLPSTCYMCTTNGCYAENFAPLLDYFIIPQFLIIAVYFLLLFGLKIHQKPSMKRRIGVPYSPILILVIMLTFTGLSRTCVCIWYSVSVFSLIWWFLIYVATIIRFYYLRNLYSLIVAFPQREKVLKMLASQKAGFLFTVVFTFPLAQLLNLVSVYFFVNENKISADIFRPVVGLICLVLLWLLGSISVIFDLFIQRKTIGKDGIRKFFFFDDPFYLRVDLLSTIMPLLIIILTGIENSIAGAANSEVLLILIVLNGVFNTLLCLSFLQISGGNVLIIEIYKMIRKRKKEQILTLDQELENPELLLLLKEYCEKEFSLENYEFFTKLKALRRNKFIKLKELQEIDSEFVKNYSKYEVNIPATCKKNFYALVQRCESETQLEFELVWKCFEGELLLNLQDTFSRLQGTSTYSKWLSVQQLKDSNHIL